MINKLETQNDLIEAFDSYNELIYKMIFFRVRRLPELAEDLSQEVFIRAWEKRSSFDSSKSSLKHWLIIIAGNLVIDYFRKHKTESVSQEILDMQPSNDNIDKDVMMEFVTSKLELLEESDRELIIMRYINDIDLKEISEITGKSYDAVKVQIHRILNKFKKILNGEI